MYIVIVDDFTIFFHVFFFNDTATTEIYTLSLHDALPILGSARLHPSSSGRASTRRGARPAAGGALEMPAYLYLALAIDRKSTRLNSSHANISYAVFCLKKKKTNKTSFRSVHITLYFISTY